MLSQKEQKTKIVGYPKLVFYYYGTSLQSTCGTTSDIFGCWYHLFACDCKPHRPGSDLLQDKKGKE